MGKFYNVRRDRQNVQYVHNHAVSYNIYIYIYIYIVHVI